MSLPLDFRAFSVAVISLKLKVWKKKRYFCQKKKQTVKTSEFYISGKKEKKNKSLISKQKWKRRKRRKRRNEKGENKEGVGEKGDKGEKCEKGEKEEKRKRGIGNKQS